MSSPSKPVNIGSPRFSPTPIAGTPGGRRDSPSLFGTPVTSDLRSLRAAHIGTPPLPNIPPRTGTSTPRPSASTEPLAFAGDDPGGVSSVGGISARRPAVIGLGLEGVSTPDPTTDVDSLQEDDKVKVLRKHLVSREERQGNISRPPSRQSSISQFRPRQEDSEAFPVPYHTPGADITYVCM